MFVYIGINNMNYISVKAAQSFSSWGYLFVYLLSVNTFCQRLSAISNNLLLKIIQLLFAMWIEDILSVKEK